MIKDATPATNDQFFYFETRVEYADVITNPETGAFFTVTGSSLFKESQARGSSRATSSPTTPSRRASRSS